jgi:hypothetical protein
MVYGFEAILPTDLEYGAPRVRVYNDQASLKDAVDQLEEAREVALVHSTNYQKPYASTTIAMCGVRRSTSGT